MLAVNVNVNGQGIAVKDIDSQVVTLNVTQNGHRNYVGISDTSGTGYYIRVNGTSSETRKAGNTKRGSCGIELDVVNLFSGPNFFIFVPNTNFDVVVVSSSDENVFWKSELNTNGIWLNLTCWVRIRNVPKTIFN
jgi:hypothetical protein